MLDLATTGRTGFLLAINLMLLLITIVGGRIVPSFTLTYLRRRDGAAAISKWSWVERVCVASVLGVLALDLILPDSEAAGGAALAAAVFQAIRISGWRGTETAREPLLWILHLGYAWAPVGLLLKAAWLLTGATWAAQ